MKSQTVRDTIRDTVREYGNSLYTSGLFTGVAIGFTAGCIFMGLIR